MSFMFQVVTTFMLFGTLFVGLAMRDRFSGKDSAELEGQRYEYEVMRSKRQIVAVSIALTVPDEWRFVLRREYWFDRFFKSLGLAREWQTNDPQFDQAVYIVSEDRLLLETLSGDPELRRCVEQLLQRRSGSSLNCYRGKLWLVCAPDKEISYGDSDAVVAGAMALSVHKELFWIGKRLISQHADAWTTTQAAGLWRSRVILTLCLVLGALGIISSFWQHGLRMPRVLIRDEIHQHAAQLTLVCAAALVALLMALVGRTSRTPALLAAIMLVGVPGAWLTAGAFCEAWDEGDQAVTQNYRAVIAGKRAGYGGRNNRYYLRIEAWPDLRIPPEFEVDFSTYNALQSGQCVRLDIHPGTLRDPWISGISAMKSC